MITELVISKKSEYGFLLEFLIEHSDYDFYFTEDNNRIYVTDLKSLKKLLKNTSKIYIQKEKDDYIGCVLILKSFDKVQPRYYIKVCAKSTKIAKDILTVLLWDSKKELFIKLRKDSKFLNIFKEKGFRFQGSRGVQILLNRKPMIYEKVFKPEDNNVGYK